MDDTLNLGIITLLPIVVLFVLIFSTKRMLLSLTSATVVGAIILGVHGIVKDGISGGFLGGIKAVLTGIGGKWLTLVQQAFMEGTTGYLFLLLALFGILIALLDISGAVLDFANWLAKYANTRKKALIITYILGWLIFVDDYLNNMAVSTAMKRVCDKHRIPRTYLGYIVNSTAAPVCVLIPISTWAVFYGGLFESNGVVGSNGTGAGAYIQGLPFLFYALISVLIALLTVIGIVPLIGITRRDNKLAKEQGILISEEESIDGKALVFAEDEAEVTKKPGPFSFLIPLVLLIAVTVLTGDVMIGCILSIILVGIMMIVQKKTKLGEFFDTAWSGVTSMAYIMAVIAMALTIVQINTQDGLSTFVVNSLTPVFENIGFLLPAIVFAFCAVYSYFGGGFWDMSMVFMPIVVPLAGNLNVDPILTCCALVCAATAGSTTYAAGDAVQITARAVDIKPYYQMLGTLPYAAISYVLSVAAFAVAGFFRV